MRIYSKNLIILFAIALFACDSGSSGENNNISESFEKKEPKVEATIKEGKGIGEAKNVVLNESIDENLVAKGKAIYDMKCSACHKLDDQKFVGPGFQGITNRRKPEWIMNMMTNVDAMLEKDPTAKSLLEQYLTKMPDQNVSMEEARGILEFFRKNDLEKMGKKDEAANI